MFITHLSPYQPNSVVNALKLQLIISRIISFVYILIKRFLLAAFVEIKSKKTALLSFRAKREIP